MRILTRARADQRGFTLAELLVAIAILGLVMIGVLTLLMTGNQSYLTGSNQAEAQAALRAALARMTTDIREAGYDPTGTGCTTTAPPPCWLAIISLPFNSFVIQSDWDGSGAIQAGVTSCVNYSWAAPCPPPGGVLRGEQITYTVVAGGTLCRQESAIDLAPVAPCAAGMPLVTSVQQAISGGDPQAFFTYLDVNGTTILPGATPELIRTIWVQMRAGVQNQPPAIWQAGAVQVTMSDRIRLRNR